MATIIPQGARLETIEDIVAANFMPFDWLPTVEHAMVEVQTPLDNQSANLLLGAEINPWGTLRGNQAANIAQSWSTNLGEPGLRPKQGFLCYGFCVYLMGEPFQFALDGNQFWTTAQVQTAIPISPRDLLMTAANGQVPSGGTYTRACAAQFDWGRPQQEASYWFQNAFDAVVLCPESAADHEIMRVRCADIGNCCSNPETDGYSVARGGWFDKVISTNQRLMAMTAATSTDTQLYVGVQGAWAVNTGTVPDCGQFIPLNARLRDISSVSAATYTAERALCEPVATGALHPGVGSEKWMKFTNPIIVSQDTPIPFVFRRNNTSAGQVAQQRMVNALTQLQCISPSPGATAVGFNSYDPCACTSTYYGYGNTRQSKLPAGTLRIGIGLKGMFASMDVCRRAVELSRRPSVTELVAAGNGQYNIAGTQVETSATLAGRGIPGGSCGGGGCTG